MSGGDNGSAGVIALLPFGLILGAGLVTFLLTMGGGKFSAEDTQRLVTDVVIVLLLVGVVATLACLLCYRIRPVELFVAGVIDISGSMERLHHQDTDEVQELWTAVGKTEQTVCKLMGQTDDYIRSGLGPKGKDDPSLVTTAQQDARADAGGSITDCTTKWPTTVADVSAQTLDETMGQLDDRIGRMETTLKGFSAPVLLKAYQSTVECNESFGDYAPIESFVATSLKALQERLKQVQAAVQYQETKYIGGMEQKKKELQAGQVSDCDKKRGAKTAMAAGSKAGQ